MRIYLDLDSRRLLTTPTRPLSLLEFKRRDNDSIELQFLRDAVVQQLPAGTTARVGIKPEGDYDAEFLAVTTLTQSGTGTATVYSGALNLNTTALATAFDDEPVTLPTMLEVEWLTGDVVSSSKTLPATIHNDVIRGDEGDPADLPVFYTSETSNFKATQAQAEAGADNATWMTPLRTAQAIEALGGTGGGVSSWNDLTDKPSTFPPATHDHDGRYYTETETDTLLAGKQAAGSYAPATGIDPSAITGTAVITTDGRLSDSRSPLSHTHGNITNAGAIGSTASLPIITGASGVLQAGSFGTTTGTFAAGDHTHSNFVVNGGSVASITRVTAMPATPVANTLYIVIP